MEQEDSYIVIVNDSDEIPGIKVFNFDSDIKPEEKKTICHEFEKVFKESTNDNKKRKRKQTFSVRGEEIAKVKIKDEPLDYEENDANILFSDVEYLNTDDEYLISNDDTSEHDSSTTLLTEPVKKNVKKPVRKNTKKTATKKLQLSERKSIKPQKKSTGRKTDSSQKKGNKSADSDNVWHVPAESEVEPAITVKVETQEAENESASQSEEKPMIVDLVYSDLDEETREKVDHYVSILQKEMGQRTRPVPEDAIKKVDNMFLCTYCKHLTDHQYYAIQHFKFRHDDRIFNCLACSATFRRLDLWKQHEAFCEGEDIRLVRLAREIYHERKMMFPSNKRSKNKKKEACPECGMQIAKSSIKMHLARHTSEWVNMKKMFPCTQCTAVYCSKRALDAHLNAHKGIRPYKCLVCEKTFSSKNNLLSHKWVHYEKRFECNECSRPYCRKFLLIRHIAEAHTQNGEKILCPKCGLHILKGHYKAHSNGCSVLASRTMRRAPGKFNCIDCGRKYGTMVNLNAHMKSHHGKTIFRRQTFLKMLPEITTNASELEFDLVKTEDIEGEAAQEELQIHYEPEDTAQYEQENTEYELEQYDREQTEQYDQGQTEQFDQEQSEEYEQEQTDPEAEEEEAEEILG